jgi:hypothetical protein
MANTCAAVTTSLEANESAVGMITASIQGAELSWSSTD